MVHGFWAEKSEKAAKFWKIFSSPNPALQVSEKQEKNLRIKEVCVLDFSGTH